MITFVKFVIAMQEIVLMKCKLYIKSMKVFTTQES